MTADRQFATPAGNGNKNNRFQFLRLSSVCVCVFVIRAFYWFMAETFLDDNGEYTPPPPHPSFCARVRSTTARHMYQEVDRRESQKETLANCIQSDSFGTYNNLKKDFPFFRKYSTLYKYYAVFRSFIIIALNRQYIIYFVF